MIRKKFSISTVIIYLVIGLFSLSCLFPFLTLIGGSFTSEDHIRRYGYQIIPTEFSLDAYNIIFRAGGDLWRAYGVTIFVTVVGTISSLLISSMLAYSLSHRKYALRGTLTMYLLITMLFSGGLVPWYMVCVNILHLRNTVWAMIVPLLLSPFNVFLIRNYFQSLPFELHESAKIDGASELRIYVQIIMPLAVPVLATVSLFNALGYWNDWYTAMLLVDEKALKPLQMLLRDIQSSAEFLREFSKFTLTQGNLVPRENLKLAVCLITIGPIILVYPFVQRFFVKGIMVGAIKG